MVTIILPVSRPHYLRRIFAQLDMMPCDVNNTNLLVYVDGDMMLFNDTRNYVLQSKFIEKLCVYRKKGKPSVNHINSRRERIAKIHNEIKEIVGGCDYVFLLEDDTLIPLNTLDKLLKDYSVYPYAGFISGVQVGRWGMTACGLWKVDNPYNIQHIQSQLPPAVHNIQEIDAAGLYCCLAKREHYVTTEFTPFAPILGPDVSFGLALRQRGFKNYVDWSIQTAHLTKQGEIKVHNTTLQKVTFQKTEKETWSIQVI